MHCPTFVLASASPARHRLLSHVGIHPIVCPSHLDESLIQHDEPDQLVQALALAKAQTVAQTRLDGTHKAAANPSEAETVVLGCDSVLWFEGNAWGKPQTPEEAIARWKLMRGRSGELYTGHALICQPTGHVLVRSQVTVVEFAQVSDRQIEAYVETQEPLHCAGCFALEGKGGLFVERIIGCHSNVIGLSLPLLRQMLAEVGYDVTRFW